MIGVRSVFSEKELDFMKRTIGLELSDTKDYSDAELDAIYDLICDELPCDFDEEGYPLESGRLFESIIDKFYDYLDK